MTRDDFIASFKYSVLQQHIKTRILLVPVESLIYQEPSTIKWLKRFNKLDYPGLLNQQRSKPSVPNQIKPDK